MKPEERRQEQNAADSVTGSVGSAWPVAVLVIPILLVETGVMLLLPAIGVTSPLTSLFIDVAALAAVMVPLNYFLVYRRLMASLDKSHRSGEELRRLTASLEEQVKDRTTMLATSEAEVHSVLESSAEGILRIDTKGIIQMANRAAHRLLGYKGMDLTGQHVSAIIPDDHLKILVEGYISFLGGWSGESHFETVAATGLKKNGDRVDMELSISECIIGQKIQYVLIMRDISERKQAEEALRRSEERYRILIEQGHVIAWEMDIATLRFTYISSHAEKLLGYLAQDWMQAGRWQEWIHPEDRDWVVRYCTEGATKKEDHVYEFRMVAADGNTVWLENLVSVQVDRNSGKPVSLHGFMIDITERKRAEEAMLRAKIAAEEATKLKDKFVTLVSHDLRGPLGVMMGFIKLAHSRMIGPNEELRDILGRAVGGGQKMLALISDLLDIGRLHTGKIVPQIRFIDAFLVIEKAVELLTPIASSKGIKIDNVLPRGVRVYADDTLLGEVFQNLLSNAIKFCRKGDSVRIYMEKSQNPTIAVSDTGIGMSQRQRERIFSYEEKTSTIGTSNEEGTGLGLPLSNEIMEAHGGRLSVQSEPGRGSTFFVELPYFQPKILIVDDNGNDRLLVRQHLEPIYAEIVEAAGGKEAIDILQKREINLIISNVWMPDMNGFDLLILFRQTPNLNKIPVIVLTGDNSMETRQRALGLGATDFVTKPVDPTELLPRIRHIIG